MNGGAAFPSPGVVIDERSYQRHQGAYEGMSLRHYFAAKALLVSMSDLSSKRHEQGRQVDEHDREYVARRCYEWADAMIKAAEA